MRSRPPRRVLGLLPLVLIMSLSGCSTPYLIHLGIGQSRIMLARKDYPAVLKDPDIGTPAKSLMLVIQEVKNFGEETLGLKKTDSFGSYVKLDREAVSWNVMAAEKTSLESYEWWFPIVGRVPYKGYFSTTRAEKEARRLAEKGYDTYVGGVTAYSTLGYFADPVFSTFLRFPESEIPELILHELTHATLFIKGEVDFNEGFATFVGHKGGLAFLEERFGPDSEPLQEATARFRDEVMFGKFIANLSDKLEALYKEGHPEDRTLQERETIFNEGKHAFVDLQNSFTTKRYEGFAAAEWNNALILAHRRYDGDLPAFEKLYAQVGGDLQRMFDFFRDVKGRGENPLEALRRATLDAGEEDATTGERS